MLTRAAALESIAGGHFEVVVIGGGITGAGVALDAASRGYSVALLERDDFAVGTSSRSSKMVHGGLRYLQNFDLGLVREALLERQLLVHLAPHLVYPTPFLVAALGEEQARPQGRHRAEHVRRDGDDAGRSRPPRQARETLRAGRARRNPGGRPDRHRTIDHDEVLGLVPALASRDPHDAYLFYDCQTDDVRLVLTVLGEAERYGAVALNGAEVVEVTGGAGPRRRGRLRRGRLGRTGRGHRRPRGQRDRRLGRLDPPRGDRGGGRAADRAQPRHPPAARRRRPADGERRLHRPGGRGADDLRPALVRADADRHHRQRLRRATPATRARPRPKSSTCSTPPTPSSAPRSGRGDLVGAYAGVRPLISSGDPRKSVDISRKEELYETSSGMLTITGGKLTTYRRMAKLTVDRLVLREGREAPCRTAEIPLGMEARPADLEAPDGVGEEALSQLAFRYGHASRKVLDLARERPELAAPMVPGRPDLMAEAVLAARHEQARSLADVLLRRTRLGILAAPALRDPEVAAADRRGARGRSSAGRRRGWRAEVAAWDEVAASEGVDPAAEIGGAGVADGATTGSSADRVE